MGIIIMLCDPSKKGTPSSLSQIITILSLKLWHFQQLWFTQSSNNKHAFPKLWIHAAILTGMGTAQTTPPILQFIWIAILVATDINCLALLMSARNHHLRWHCKQVRQFVSWCFQPSQTPIFQFIWAAIFAATGISCLALLSVPETTIWDGTANK